jgi:nitronate monooxygenase
MNLELNSYEEQVDAIIEEGCKIVSFTFGSLDHLIIQKLKSNGIILIGTGTSVAEAILLEKSGINIFCVQGIEAGGHRVHLQEPIYRKLEGSHCLQKHMKQ